MIVVVTCVLLLLGELILRFGLGLGGPPPVSDRQPPYVYNPDYGLALRADFELAYNDKSNGIENQVWSTNSQGFRGPELRDDAAPRVMVYGDSQIHGKEVSLEDTFVKQLEKRLQAQGFPDAEVVNAGLSGAGPDQNLIRIETESLQYEPDVIVFTVFADNDFGDLMRNRLYELNDSGELQRVSYPVVIDQMLEPPRSLLKESGWAALANTLQKKLSPPRSPGSITAEERIQKGLVLAEAEYEVYAKGKPREFSHYDDRYDMDLALFPQQESSQTKRELMTAVLGRMQAFTEANGVGFLILILPSPMDMTENFAWYSYKDFAAYEEYGQKNLSDAVLYGCEASSINCVNLYPVYEQHDPASLYYSHRNNHWNEKGQSLAADAVLPALLETLVQREAEVAAD